MRTALLGAALLAAGCTGGDPQAPGAAPAAQAAASSHEPGRKVWNFRCYYCHGYSGDARTLAATYLDPKPRDFTRATPADLPRERILAVLREGRPGTAMASFANTLSQAEMEAVADFVRVEFMERKAPNTRYHTAENGWPNHERHRAAFAFATGEIALDTPWESLSPERQEGKRLFLATCVTCHDRAKVNDEGKPWEPRVVSWPRAGFVPGGPPVDATASASPYAIHDRPPAIAGLKPDEKKGAALYQANCAFCHAADGTGRNWIGTFLQPHPRDLTSEAAMAGMTKSRLRQVIRDGLPGTSMPAWKHVLKPDEVDAITAYVSRAFRPLPEG